jgi:hypothetical protein
LHLHTIAPLMATTSFAQMRWTMKDAARSLADARHGGC